MYSEGETDTNEGQRTVVLQPRQIRNDGKVLGNFGKRVIDNCHHHFGFHDTCPTRPFRDEVVHEWSMKEGRQVSDNLLQVYNLEWQVIIPRSGSVLSWARRPIIGVVHRGVRDSKFAHGGREFGESL
jgi:hypothetical protein